MTKKSLALHSMVLSGALALTMAGSEGRPQQILQGADQLVELETQAARSPGADSVGRLAVAYLDRNEPGLAQSVLDRHIALQGAELSHARARVALARGSASEALEHAELAVLRCDSDPCTAKLTGRALQQRSYLRALVAAGVEDPRAEPAAAEAALFASARQVHLASR